MTRFIQGIAVVTLCLQGKVCIRTGSSKPSTARKTTLVSLFILCFSNIHTQVNITPLVGVSVSKIKNIGYVDEYTFYSYEDIYQGPEINLGIDFSKPLSSTFEIGFGVSYNSGHAEAVNGCGGCAPDYGFISVSYKYLYVSPKVNYTYKSFLVLSSGLFAGINIEATGYETTFFGETEFDYKDIIHNQSYGIQFGIGFKIKSCLLQLEYLHGINEVIQDDRIRWLECGIGYQIEVGAGKK